MGARHGACLAICPMVHVRGVFAPRGSVSRCAGCLTGIVIKYRHEPTWIRDGRRPGLSATVGRVFSL